MRIKIQQFLFAKAHSWAVVGQNLGRAFLKLGHDVEFISTDGFQEQYCPEDLRPFRKEAPSGKYDLQLSYTAPHNWGAYTRFGGYGKAMAIWNFEYNGKSILPGFSKNHKNVDVVLPSSNFTKEVFVNMGIPAERMVVVPHGINLQDMEGSAVELKTKATKKILLNIAQPHKRKAIPLALESFGKAFSKNDDVCLVIKVILANKADQQFDIDFMSVFKTFKNRFPNCAEIEIVNRFIPNLSDIYRSCDINFTATHTECFWLPGIEAFACGLLNVAPRYGGLLDFCNDENCVLIDGKTVRVPRDHVYWQASPHLVHFDINTDDAAKKLIHGVQNYDALKAKFSDNVRKTVEKFTWENAANQILELM